MNLVSQSSRALVLAPVALFALAGCKPGRGRSAAHRPPSLGRALAQTPARGLKATPDGKTLLFIGDVRPPAEKTAPEGLHVGVLTSVAADGGAPRTLGGGVPTTDDGFRLSADGRHVAFLSGYRFVDHAGDLHVAGVASGEPKLVANGVSFYGFSPDGKHLGLVAAGAMSLLDVDTGQMRPMGGGAATFSFSPDGKRVLVRRQTVSGGGLDLYAVTSVSSTRLATGVGEYKFSPDGKDLAYTARSGGPAAPLDLYAGPVEAPTRPKIGTSVADFAFSPDGRWIAFVSGVSLQKTLAELMLVPASGGRPRKVGDFVEQFQFAPDSAHLAWREFLEDHKRGLKWHRLMVVPTAAGEPRKLGDGVPNFLWSHDGRLLGFLKIFEKPAYSLDLMLHRVGDPSAPGRIQQGTFSYSFGPKDRFLFFRTACVRDGRACELWHVATGADQPAAKLADGVWDFRVSESGERLLVTYARSDSAAGADIAVVNLTETGRSPKGVDQHAVGAPLYLDREGRRAAYLVGERKREGVYVADLP